MRGHQTRVRARRDSATTLPVAALRAPPAATPPAAAEACMRCAADLPGTTLSLAIQRMLPERHTVECCLRTCVLIALRVHHGKSYTSTLD